MRKPDVTAIIPDEGKKPPPTVAAGKASIPAPTVDPVIRAIAPRTLPEGFFVSPASPASFPRSCLMTGDLGSSRFDLEGSVGLHEDLVA